MTEMCTSSVISVNVGMINVQNNKRKNKRKTGQITALKEGFYSDKDTICLPRQDSWTTCNPRNNGAKWGIIRCPPCSMTTGRLLFSFFKRKNVKAIVNTVYIV